MDPVVELASDGEYAGNDAIVAFSRCYGIAVAIHQLGVPRWEVGAWGGAAMLHVAYLRGEHYCSVRALEPVAVMTFMICFWPLLKRVWHVMLCRRAQVWLHLGTRGEPSRGRVEPCNPPSRGQLGELRRREERKGEAAGVVEPDSLELQGASLRASSREWLHWSKCLKARDAGWGALGMLWFLSCSVSLFALSPYIISDCIT